MMSAAFIAGVPAAIFIYGFFLALSHLGLI
jgi:hypothetical protein